MDEVSPEQLEKLGIGLRLRHNCVQVFGGQRGGGSGGGGGADDWSEADPPEIIERLR